MLLLKAELRKGLLIN